MNKIKQSESELWAKRIKEQEKSGRSLASWCKENNLCRTSLYRWKKRLAPKSSQTPTKPFSRVMVVETPTGQGIDPVWTAKFLKELFR